MRKAVIVGLICFVCLLLTAATVINGARDFVELTAGGAPASGNVRLWAKTTDHSLYATDSTGASARLGGGGGGGGVNVVTVPLPISGSGPATYGYPFAWGIPIGSGVIASQQNSYDQSRLQFGNTGTQAITVYTSLASHYNASAAATLTTYWYSDGTAGTFRHSAATFCVGTGDVLYPLSFRTPVNSATVTTLAGGIMQAIAVTLDMTGCGPAKRLGIQVARDNGVAGNTLSTMFFTGGMLEYGVQ